MCVCVCVYVFIGESGAVGRSMAAAEQHLSSVQNICGIQINTAANYCIQCVRLNGGKHNVGQYFRILNGQYYVK